MTDRRVTSSPVSLRIRTTGHAYVRRRDLARRLVVTVDLSAMTKDVIDDVCGAGDAFDQVVAHAQR